MPTLRKIANRVHTLADRDAFERDLDDELRFHLAMEEEKNAARGLADEEARAAAPRDFGGLERFKDEVRDARGLTWLDDARRDVRFGLRSLRRSPAFTWVAVLCLALGIGANAALFSVVDAVLLRPLPYAQPERLVRLYEKLPSGGQGTVSVPNLRDWREQATSFEHLAAWQDGNLTLAGAAEPERIPVVEATAELFAILGTPPLLGRAFAPGDDAPGRTPVVVVGERLWRARFSADPALVGRTIRLDGQPHTVIGVMPAAFDFPPGGAGTDAWTTGALPREANRGSHMLSVVGRLRPGVALARARVDLAQVAARLERQYPEQAGRSALVQPLRETVVGSSRKALAILFGAVALVLLIACANVANLLLARAATRRREVAVRLALGASRARLVRQFLVESLVLAAAGALGGALFAAVGLALLSPLVQGALPILGGLRLDGRIFAFLLAATVASALAFGLAPALQAVREEARDVLGDSGTKASAGRRQRRVRSTLVVLEIAVSLVLLVGAGLLLRSFWRLAATPSGLDTRNVLTAHLAVPGERLAGARAAVFDPLLTAVRHLPGVRSAALISMLPLQSAWTNGEYQVVGRPAPPPGHAPLAELRLASPELFAALGIPLRGGRDFAGADLDPEARVVIVNEALAHREFPGGNAVGQQLLVGGDQPFTIIGVVGSVRQAGLDREPLREVYFSYAAAPGMLGDATLVVRTSVPPASLVPAVRRALGSVDPTLPLFSVATMESVVADSLARRRLNLWLLGLFAGIALALAAAGLFGVISYLVAERRREIGTRVALGAQQRDVLGLLMRQGAALTAAGLGLGLAGALAFTRLLDSLLDGVGARDPLSFAGSAALLAAVAGLATWLPARRALAIEPKVAIEQ